MGRRKSPRSALRTTRRCERQAAARDHICRSRSRLRSAARLRAARRDPAGSNCARRAKCEGDFPSTAAIAKSELVDDSAKAEASEPDHEQPIAVSVADQPEVVEESPHGREAEREAARPEDLDRKS